MSRPAIVGWIMNLAGFGLWLYGYLTVGWPPFFNWAANTPVWVSEFVPTLNAEIGMALMLVGSGLTFWPARPEE